MAEGHSVQGITLPPGVAGWGQRKGEQGVSLPVSEASTATALFEVRCGPKHLSRYFRDASVLVIEVHDQEREAPSLVGKAVVELKKVEAHTPLVAQIPVAAANGRVLGHVEAVLSVHFLPVVTSFEMNEHLAATDTSLPLYPGPGQAPRRIIPEGAEEPNSTMDTIDHAEQRQQPQHKRSEPAPPTDVFAKLGEFVDRRHSRLLELFRQYDGDHDGALNINELHTLLHAISPTLLASRADAAYFSAMLDANDDAVMTYGELASVIRECRAAHFAAQPGGLSDVLRRVAQLLQQHHQDLAHLFHVIDRRDSGVLDYSQVKQVVRQLVPGLTPREVRHLLARAHMWDASGEGTLTLPELQTAFTCSSAAPPKRTQSESHDRSTSPPAPPLPCSSPAKEAPPAAAVARRGAATRVPEHAKPSLDKALSKLKSRLTSTGAARPLAKPSPDTPASPPHRVQPAAGEAEEDYRDLDVKMLLHRGAQLRSAMVAAAESTADFLGPSQKIQAKLPVGSSFLQDVTNLQLSTESDACILEAAKAGMLGSLVIPGQVSARGGIGSRESLGLFDPPSESEMDDESDRTSSLGSYGYTDESEEDAEETAEHMLIQELYFSQDTHGVKSTVKHRDASCEVDMAEQSAGTQQGGRCWADAVPATAILSPVQRPPACEQPQQAWLQVSASYSSSVILRFRPLATAQPERQLALHAAHPGVLRLPWSSALHAGLLLAQRTLLVAEMWEATGEADERLVGVVKIPLQLPADASALPAMETPPLAQGSFAVWNPFRGMEVGQLHAEVYVHHADQPDQAWSEQRAAAATSTATSTIDAAASTRIATASAMTWREHTFDVTLERLVGAPPLTEEAQQEHGGVYLSYLFPGESEPLYTQVVPYSVEGIQFRGTATHSVWLAETVDEATIAPHEVFRAWAADGIASRNMQFEVWNKQVGASETEDTLLGSASLPLLTLAELIADQSKWAGDAPLSSFELEVDLDTASDHAASPRLQLRVEHSCKLHMHSTEFATADDRGDTVHDSPRLLPDAAARASEPTASSAVPQDAVPAEVLLAHSFHSHEEEEAMADVLAASVNFPLLPADSATVVVCVERMLHLPTVEHGVDEDSSKVRVSYQWLETGETVSTSLVTRATAAQWFHSRYLPLAFSRRRTTAERILLLHVHERSEGAAAEQLVGCVALDLEPLRAGLHELRGWYHILNAHQQPTGQLKLRVAPADAGMLAASVAHRLVVEPDFKRENVLSSSGAEEVTSPLSITQLSVDETVDDAALLERLRTNMAELDAIASTLRLRLVEKDRASDCSRSVGVGHEEKEAEMAKQVLEQEAEEETLKAQEEDLEAHAQEEDLEAAQNEAVEKEAVEEAVEAQSEPQAAVEAAVEAGDDVQKEVSDGLTAGTTANSALLTALLHTEALAPPQRDARELLEDLQLKAEAVEANALGYRHPSPLVFTAGTSPGVEEASVTTRRTAKTTAETRSTWRSLEDTVDAETLRVLRIMGRKGMRSSAQ